MLKKVLLGIAVALAVTILPAQAKADPISFISILTSSQETPPNSSLALGFGTVTLNDARTAAILSLQWAGLTSNLTAAHMHLGAPGVAGTRLLNFASSGGTSGLLTNVDWIFEPVPTASGAVLSIQDQVDALLAGNIYFNIHTVEFPGGEIRGQVQQDCSAVPEPMTMILLGTGLVGVAARVRKRSRANRDFAS